MYINHKNWSLIVCGVLFVTAISMPVINWIVDPYDVFGSNVLRNNGYASNERFLKVNKLKKDSSKYSGYIIGSSVMGTYDPDTASKLRGKNYYNLAFLGGYPSEALNALKYIKKNNGKIDEVVMGVDLFWFDKEKKTPVIWKREHYEVIGVSKESWFYDYLIGINIKDVAMKIQNNIGDINIKFDWQKSGMYLLPEQDRLISKDEDAFIKNKVKLINDGSVQNLTVVEARVKELRDLKDWLDQEKIHCYCFINPVNISALNQINQSDLNKVRTKVIEVMGDIKDYSKDATYTENNHLYYDTRHIKTSASNLILNNLLKGS